MRPARGGGAQALRIIGGAWRGRRIRFPDVPGLRPTPDRVRETLFNWLGQDLSGRRCLDLFAGSGALGFEAASRGARDVAMLDAHAQVVKSLRDTAELLGASAVRASRGDALEFLRQAPSPYDVVFLDPPFGSGLDAAALAMLAPWLAPGGRVYLESGSEYLPEGGWRVHRAGRAGQVHYHLLERE